MPDHVVMPWWMNYLLVNPVRKLFDPPKRLLSPVVAEGMTIIEPGCGMGYYSLPMARMIGQSGKLYCLDLDVRIINGLTRRAVKKELHHRIEARVIKPHSLDIRDLAGQADLCAVLNLVHEVPDKVFFFKEIYASLKPGGRMLLVEPSFRIKQGDYENELALAVQSGFALDHSIQVEAKMGAVLKKPLAQGLK